MITESIIIGLSIIASGFIMALAIDYVGDVLAGKDRKPDDLD